MRAEGLTPILNVSSMEESFRWFAKLGWANPDGHVFRIGTGLEED